MLHNQNVIYTTNTQDDGFSITVATVLLGIGADSYIPIFKKYNFGKKDIEELTNEDLIIMGIDDSNIREKILKIFLKKQDTNKPCQSKEIDCETIIKEATKLMELTTLSLNCCKRNLSQCRNPEDVLVKANIYATDIMLESLHNIENKFIRISNKICIDKKKKNTQQVTIVSSLLLALIGISYYKFIK